LNYEFPKNSPKIPQRFSQSSPKKPGTNGENHWGILNLALQNILKCSKIGIVNFKEVKLDETRYQRIVETSRKRDTTHLKKSR
jgi:hypothetical protein